ncbi:MAG: UPF0158 family protein [bacterium]
MTALRVKLSEIIGGMEFQSDETSSFLDRRSGRVVSISDSEYRAAEDGDPLEDYPEWEQEIIQTAADIEKNPKDCVLLPSKFDIHEYRIMEKFCLSIEDTEICERLYHAIKGRGAFRRFKDEIHRLDIADDWYKFRDEALKKISIEWCEANKIEYADD